MLFKKLSLQKLFDEVFLHVADVRLIIYLVIKIVLLYKNPHVVRKCVLQLVVFVQ